jgi:phosphohistidine phosphatase SixA
LDLLRHGDALAAIGGGDAERQLSDAGRDAITRVAEEYLRRGWHPERVYSSPLRRARQSAAILAHRIKPAPDYEILDALVPDEPPEQVVGQLASAELPPHVVLVGHQPSLGRLTAHLTGGREPSVPTAGVLVLRFQASIAAAGAVLELQWRPERVG